jgi:hypothetical protein
MVPRLCAQEVGEIHDGFHLMEAYSHLPGQMCSHRSGPGPWKARDGHLIDRIPSRHQLKSDALRAKLQVVEMALSRLRAKYDDMIKTGVLRRWLKRDSER